MAYVYVQNLLNDIQRERAESRRNGEQVESPFASAVHADVPPIIDEGEGEVEGAEHAPAPAPDLSVNVAGAPRRKCAQVSRCCKSSWTAVLFVAWILSFPLSAVRTVVIGLYNVSQLRYPRSFKGYYSRVFCPRYHNGQREAPVDDDEWAKLAWIVVVLVSAISLCYALTTKVVVPAEEYTLFWYLISSASEKVVTGLGYATIETTSVSNGFPIYTVMFFTFPAGVAQGFFLKDDPRSKFIHWVSGAGHMGLSAYAHRAHDTQTVYYHIALFLHSIGYACGLYARGFAMFMCCCRPVHSEPETGSGTASTAVYDGLSMTTINRIRASVGAAIAGRDNYWAKHTGKPAAVAEAPVSAAAAAAAVENPEHYGPGTEYVQK